MEFYISIYFFIKKPGLLEICIKMFFTVAHNKTWKHVTFFEYTWLRSTTFISSATARVWLWFYHRRYFQKSIIEAWSSLSMVIKRYEIIFLFGLPVGLVEVKTGKSRSLWLNMTRITSLQRFYHLMEIESWLRLAD